MDDSIYDKVGNEFKALIDKYFPYFQIRHTGNSGLNFRVDLPQENRHYNNSPYYYKGELTFIHWTSLNNLTSILNSREIRFYNLFNSKDKDEFGIAASTLGLSEKQIELFKNYYYTFSFCKKEDLFNKFLWEEYGNKFTGVAIEFTIEDNIDKWENFMISNVYYDLPQQFSDFFNDLSILGSQYSANFELNLGKVIGFYKKTDFHEEREVRMATFFPYKTNEEYLKFTKTEYRIDEVDVNRNRITNYFTLPLWVDNDSSLLKTKNINYDRRSQFDSSYFEGRPMIKIKNIYFGYRCGLNVDQFRSFRNSLSSTIRYNFGYPLKLDSSFIKDTL